MWSVRSISPTQPRDDEINHLIERWTGLAGGFRDEQRVKKADHRCTGAHCGNADITHMEFARGNARCDHSRDRPRDEFDMRLANIPVFFHRAATISCIFESRDITGRIHLMHGCQQLAQARRRRFPCFAAIACDACSTSPISRRATPALIDFLESKKR